MSLSIATVKQFYYKRHEYEYGLRLHDYSIKHNTDVITYELLLKLVDEKALVIYFCSIVTKEFLNDFLKVLMLNAGLVLQLTYDDRAFVHCVEYAETGPSSSFKENVQVVIDHTVAHSVKDTSIRTFLQCLQNASELSGITDDSLIEAKLLSLCNLLNASIVPFVTDCMHKFGNMKSEMPFAFIAFCIAEYMDNR